MPRMISGYSTDTVYVLERQAEGGQLRWRLTPSSVPTYRKVYDSGETRDWLDPYFEEVPQSRVRFLGWRDGETVDGLITYCDVPWNDTFWMLDIRVREDMRRRGIGSAMVAELKVRARDERVRGISVETQINNMPAISFYTRHGFRISGFNDHLYDNDDLERQDVALFLFWEAD